jgi:hypothetical protein
LGVIADGFMIFSPVFASQLLSWADEERIKEQAARIITAIFMKKYFLTGIVMPVFY